MAFLCAVYLLTQGDWRGRATSYDETGLTDSSASGGASELWHEAPHNQVDVILAGGRENDPFLAFLELRAAFVPCSGLYAPRETVFPGLKWGASGIPRQELSAPHLLLIASSRQLLC